MLTLLSTHCASSRCRHLLLECAPRLSLFLWLLQPLARQSAPESEEGAPAPSAALSVVCCGASASDSASLCGCRLLLSEYGDTRLLQSVSDLYAQKIKQTL